MKKNEMGKKNEMPRTHMWSAHHGRNEPPGVVQIVHQLLPIACICSSSLTMPRMEQCDMSCNGPLYMFSSVLRQVVRIVLALSVRRISSC